MREMNKENQNVWDKFFFNKIDFFLITKEVHEEFQISF